MKIDSQELNEKFKEGNKIHLQGFTSTTLERDNALDFTVDYENLEIDDPEKQPLLVEIVVSGKQQCFYLNNYELSAYPGEKEVLLQDGLQYQVVSVTKQIEIINYNKKEYQKMVNVV